MFKAGKTCVFDNNLPTLRYATTQLKWANSISKSKLKRKENK